MLPAVHNLMQWFVIELRTSIRMRADSPHPVKFGVLHYCNTTRFIWHDGLGACFDTTNENKTRNTNATPPTSKPAIAGRLQSGSQRGAG